MVKIAWWKISWWMIALGKIHWGRYHGEDIMVKISWWRYHGEDIMVDDSVGEDSLGKIAWGKIRDIEILRELCNVISTERVCYQWGYPILFLFTPDDTSQGTGAVIRYSVHKSHLFYIT